MDQNQDQIDPEVAQEVISLLNKKITNLRNENYVLQVRRPSRVLRGIVPHSDLNPTERTE